MIRRTRSALDAAGVLNTVNEEGAGHPLPASAVGTATSEEVFPDDPNAFLGATGPERLRGGPGAGRPEAGLDHRRARRHSRKAVKG